MKEYFIQHILCWQEAKCKYLALQRASEANCKSKFEFNDNFKLLAVVFIQPNLCGLVYLLKVLIYIRAHD